MPNTILHQLPVSPSSAPGSSPSATTLPHTHTAAPGGEAAAFERVRSFVDARAALPMTPIRIDAATMALAVVKVLPAIQALRAQLVALPGFDPRNVDDLHDCAWAHLHTNDQYKRATRPPEQLVQASQVGTVVRDRLYAAANFHAGRGEIEAHELDRYTGMTGYKLLADDLGLLYSIFRDALPKLAQKTPLTKDEVDEAGRLRQDIMTYLAAREGSTEKVTEATRLRLATYNLLLDRYEEARAAVLYVRRREGDGETLAPSLFAGRKPRRSDSDDDEELDDTDASPAVAASTPASSAPASVGTRPINANRNDPFDP